MDREVREPIIHLDEPERVGMPRMITPRQTWRGSSDGAILRTEPIVPVPSSCTGFNPSTLRARLKKRV